MSRAVFEKIKQLLDKYKYTIHEHEPVRTSQEAAIVRERLTGIPTGIHLKQGAKAMIIRSEGKFYQFILSAAKQIDFKKVKKIIGSSRAALATAEEMIKITDCVPGSVPPFGNIFNIPVYVDKSLLENDTIDFNAGEQTISILMKREDWQKIVNPTIAEFST